MIALKSAQLVSSKKLTKDVMEFVFKSPTELPFSPGQFVNISVKDGKEGICWRAYSIARFSNGEFTLVVKIVPDGRGSEYLEGMAIGSEINFIGPVGHFTIQDEAKQMALICTGTGIVPYLAYLQKFKDDGVELNACLLWGLRTNEDVFYKDLLDQYKKDFSSFEYKICLSKDDGEGCLKGRVTKHAGEVDDFDHYYLCGNGAMIDEMRNILENENKEGVYFEKFN